MAGNMTRKLGWFATSLVLLFGAGCDFSIEKVGVGADCRQNRECLSGLECVNRQCIVLPSATTPDSEDKPINAVIPVPKLKPVDAGADASADAGDGG